MRGVVTLLTLGVVTTFVIYGLNNMNRKVQNTIYTYNDIGGFKGE